MSITCKQCGTPITVQNIDDSPVLTACPECGALVWTGKQTGQGALTNLRWSEMKLPTGVSVERSDEQLTLTRRWFHPNFIWLGLFSMVWLGVIFIGVADNWGPGIFCIPHTWIGLALLYYTLTKLVNATTISLTPNLLTIKHGPLPTWGNKTLDPTQIKQLFAKKEVKRRRKPTITYEVRLVPNKGRNQALVSNLDTPEQALFLEEEIERYLGIRDKPVSGELTQVERQLIKTLQNFAQANRLHYFRSKRVEGNRILGNFQGYQAELVTLLKDKSQDSPTIKTRITLTAKTASTPVADPQNEEFLRVDLDRLFNPAELNYSSGGSFQISANGQQLSYEEDNIEADPDYLQFLFNTLHNLIETYPKIIALGGEAIPGLAPMAAAGQHPARAVAERLIQQIALSTQHVCQNPAKLLCPRCLTRCTEHEAKISWLNNVTYCGCRMCHQNRQFYSADTVIAVLDHHMADPVLRQNSVVRVNWLIRRTLFDFDSVEIVQASDEDVERFAVQAGNDTDPVRKPAYPKIPCHVSCQLSKNTLRILQHTFETVQIA